MLVFVDIAHELRRCLIDNIHSKGTKYKGTTHKLTSSEPNLDKDMIEQIKSCKKHSILCINKSLHNT